MRVNHDSWIAASKIHRHHVEATGLILQTAARQEVDGHPDDPLLLVEGHRILAATELVSLPRLHFDEDEAWTGPGDDVNFAIASTVPALENCVPTARQFRAREIFAEFSEGLPPVHGDEADALHILRPRS